jgi:ABC-type phosphate transport system substrate-binding protein
MKRMTLALILLITLICLPVQAANILVICSKQVVESELTVDDVQKIFLGKKAFWQNGAKIVPVILEEQTIQPAFLKEYVKKTPSAFSAYWNQLLFTGKGIPPRIFENKKELVRFIAVTQGAIGYVPPETDVRNVKVLKIVK